VVKPEGQGKKPALLQPVSDNVPGGRHWLWIKRRNISLAAVFLSETDFHARTDANGEHESSKAQHGNMQSFAEFFFFSPVCTTGSVEAIQAQNRNMGEKTGSSQYIT